MSTGAVVAASVSSRNRIGGGGNAPLPDRDPDQNVVVPTDNTPISAAYRRYVERTKQKDKPGVQWRYFQATADFQEEGTPDQRFVVCTQDELRTIRKTFILFALRATWKLLRRRQHGPGVDGWYVQSLSGDGSQTWFLLGGNVEQVVAFYDSL